jgi:ABC-type phosphate transport system substrate-binding protein
MTGNKRAPRLATTITVLAFAMAPAVLTASPAGAAASHTLIQGSGSSWAANAVNQWVADVQQQGMQVVYNPSGDAQGRQDYANRTSDFAVTSLGYQGRDPLTGVSDTSQGRQYAYLPIAAGGTAFPYQIRYQGKQVRDLRLSGETLAKIFTNKITNWNDPAITKDNNGHALPSLPIVPVVQSEGSGSTWQLTRYFATDYPSIWTVGPTEYFPRSGDQIAQNGSDGAMNYVSSKSANGAIGYVEYSYALSQNYPVVKLQNKAGYFTLPTQYNVAVSLEQAQINMDKSSPNYLLQNLDRVYVDTDPRTYPLSSYVYMIEPTGKYPSPESKITTAKRQTIADFLYYSICQGQHEIGPIGYSPLPVNLVQAGFGQLKKLKQADPHLDLTERNVQTCHNPTFVPGHPSTNYLAKIAPMPPACDKTGAGPCADGVTPTGAGSRPASTGSGTHAGGTHGSSANASGGGATAGSGSTAGGAATPGSGIVASGDGSQTVSGSDGAGTTAQQVTTEPTNLVGYRSGHLTAVLAPLAAVTLLLVLVVPAALGVRMSRRRGEL